MATEYTFSNDVGEVRLAGFLTPDPAGTYPISDGSVTPVGAVTPLGIGALYVDTTAGALYIAIGATSAGWVEVGGKKDTSAAGFSATATTATATNATATATLLDASGNTALPGTLVVTGVATAAAAAAATNLPRLSQLTSALTITSGALPNTGAWVSGTAKVNPVARQVTVNVEFVTDGSSNAATCAIAVSSDNTTYTTIGTLTADTAVNTIGSVTLLAPVNLPAGWYVKLTIAHGTVAASVYY